MLKKVEIVDGKFLYRCDKCGWESKNMSKQEAEFAPSHSCPKDRTREAFS